MYIVYGEKMNRISGSQSLVPDDQQQHHLRNCEKCKLSGPGESETLWWVPEVSFKKKKDDDL